MNQRAAEHPGQSSQRPIRVLICDDHAVVHAGIEHLLEPYPNVRIVGNARDGAEGIEEFRRLRPDVVLMDLSMTPGMGGIEATERINRLDEQAKVGIFTAHDSEFDILRTFEAGARGFVVKDAPKEEIVAAIKKLADGETPISPRLAAALVKQARNRPEVLTVREVEVLQLVALGYSNPAIAGDLNMSPGTVKNHLSAIFEKLRTKDRTQAVVEAYKQGLIRFDD